uniref:Uncharacterized protein n=1 Tax=Anguilla anguilla TaxID=7936 RepID=A0A0E9XPH8_ANGAN
MLQAIKWKVNSHLLPGIYQHTPDRSVKWTICFVENLLES